MSEYEETRVLEREGEPRPPWWRENLWVWLALLALAAVALILFFVFRGGGDDERTTVPNVVGLREAAAVERLEDANLEAEIIREPSDEPEGRVTAQAPGAGTQLAEGEEVRITVSSGPTQTETETETETETQTVTTEPETTTMPDVVGQGLVDATNAVADARLWPQTYPVESTEERGTVVAQNPQPDTRLTVETPVRLNVSLGSGERESTEVPDVTGPAAVEALARCHAANLTCRIAFRNAPSPDNVGEAIEQQPRAGATVPALTQLTIYIGR